MKHTILMFLLMFNGLLLGINGINGNWFIMPINVVTMIVIINELESGVK